MKIIHVCCFSATKSFTKRLFLINQSKSSGKKSHKTGIGNIAPAIRTQKARIIFGHYTIQKISTFPQKSFRAHMRKNNRKNFAKAAKNSIFVAILLIKNPLTPLTMALRETILTLCSILIWSACGNIDLPEDENSDSTPRQKVTLYTRAAADNTLSYPVTVLAFGQDGKLKGRQEVKKSGQRPSLSLPAGHYKIIALSGNPNAEFPTPCTPHSTLSAPDPTYFLNKALMRGEAEIEIKDKKTQVHLLLGYAVSALHFSFSGIPNTITAVTMQIATVNSQMDLCGNYADPKTSKIEAHRQTDGSWATDTCYVYPDEKNPPTLSILLTDPKQNHQYNYRLNTPLLAATPYIFRGQYAGDDGMALEGEILFAGWKNRVEHNFNFGSSGKIELIPPSPNPPSPGGDSPNPSAVPRPGSLWQHHVVALVQNATATSADLLLISTETRDPIAPANSEENPNEAKLSAAEYTEQGLADWHIPTKEEAEALKATWQGDRLKTLNQTLKSIHAPEIYDKIDGHAIRYLCGDGLFTFSFATNSSIRPAGKTAQNYVMRLVKQIHYTTTP